MLHFKHTLTAEHNLTLRLWDQGSQHGEENKAKRYNGHLYDDLVETL